MNIVKQKNIEIKGKTGIIPGFPLVLTAGGDPVDMARAMGSALCNVHVCDWDAQGKLCLPGEGVFDFAALFRALREIGYRGPVILEPYLALIGSDEALLRALSHLRACMKTD